MRRNISMSRSKRVPGDPDSWNGWTCSRGFGQPCCSGEFAAPVAWTAVRPTALVSVDSHVRNDFIRCYRFNRLLPLKLSSAIQFNQETLRARVQYYGDSYWHLANLRGRGF